MTEAPTQTWYGGQNLIVDVAVVGVGLPLTFVAAAMDFATHSSTPVGIVGSLELGGFGSSIVHRPVTRTRHVIPRTPASSECMARWVFAASAVSKTRTLSR